VPWQGELDGVGGRAPAGAVGVGVPGEAAATPAAAAQTGSFSGLQAPGAQRAAAATRSRPSRRASRRRLDLMWPGGSAEDRQRQQTARVLAEAAGYDLLTQKLAQKLARQAGTTADTDAHFPGSWRDGVALITHTSDSFELQNATLVHAFSLFHRFKMVETNALERFLGQNPLQAGDVVRLRAERNMAVPLACFIAAFKLREVCKRGFCLLKGIAEACPLRERPLHSVLYLFFPRADSHAWESARAGLPARTALYRPVVQGADVILCSNLNRCKRRESTTWCGWRPPFARCLRQTLLQGFAHRAFESGRASWSRYADFLCVRAFASLCLANLCHKPTPT